MRNAALRVNSWIIAYPGFASCGPHWCNKRTASYCPTCRRLRPHHAIDEIDIGKHDPHDLRRYRTALVIGHPAGEASSGIAVAYDADSIDQLAPVHAGHDQGSGVHAFRALMRVADHHRRDVEQ